MTSLINIKQLMAMSGLSRSEILTAIESGSLPNPLPLGPWNFGWEEEVVKNWLSDRNI